MVLQGKPSENKGQMFLMWKCNIKVLDSQLFEPVGISSIMTFVARGLMEANAEFLEPKMMNPLEIRNSPLALRP